MFRSNILSIKNINKYNNINNNAKYCMKYGYNAMNKNNRFLSFSTFNDVDYVINNNNNNSNSIYNDHFDNHIGLYSSIDNSIAPASSITSNNQQQLTSFIEQNNITNVNNVDTLSSSTTAATSSVDIPSLIDVVNSTAVAVSDPLISSFGYTPDAWITRLLCSIHDYSGLPWYGAIILTTIGVRVALLPVVMKSMRNVHRLRLAKPEMERLQNLMKTNPPITEEEKHKYMLMTKDIYAKYNVNPISSLLPILVQMPIFLSFFWSLRSMSETFPSFKQGGALWFTDLSIADPTYLMPVLASAGFLITIELGGEAGEQNEQTAQMKSIFRILGIAMIPLTASIQQSVFVYWICSNTFSIFQTLLFKLPIVQKGLNLKPEIPGMNLPIHGLPKSSPTNSLQFIPKENIDQIISEGNSKAVSEARSKLNETTSTVNRRRMREIRQLQEQQQQQKP